MVTDLGSLVTMTVGLTKYPVDESATGQLGSNINATKLTITTSKNLSTGLLGLFDNTSDPLECWLVDDGSSEMSPLGTWSNSDTVHLLLEGITESTLPH